MKKENNQIDSFRNKVHLVLVLYTLGLVMWFAFFFLRILGRIRILHWERIPKKPKRLLVVANHPNLGEPGYLPFLFARDFFWNPFQAPWSTPDEKNYNKGVWKLFKPRLIFIDRRDKEKARRSFNEIARVLSSGMIVILFPEAGRTEVDQPYKKKSFFYSRNGSRKFRKFKEGVGLLIRKTNTPVLPVCVNGTKKLETNRTRRLYTLPRIENRVTIKIGKVVNFEGYKSARKITKKLETIFSKLADEE